ncbi:MAG: NAD(P)-binding protein [Pseudobdellovibrio sp.]
MSSRRDFLKTGFYGLGSIAATFALSACSTLDEFVFEDQFDLKDQVLIVGGGISGLYLAYKLRQIKTEYRLYEGSGYLGGRIRSYQDLDFGASVFDQSDVLVQALVKEFNLKTTTIAKGHFFIEGGAEKMTQFLLKRIAGLMPYRSLRLKWKMVGIYKYKDYYEVLFESPNGRRTITAKKVALAIPPSQWGRIDGLLNLPEMDWARSWLSTLQPESATKMQVIVPNSPATLALSNKRNNFEATLEKQKLLVIGKALKNNLMGLEFEYLIKQTLSNEKFKIESVSMIEIEKIIELINSKTNLNLSSKKITADSFYDWSTVSLIQSSYFKNDFPIPAQAKANHHFQVFGDYSSAIKPNTVEGAMQEANRISSLFV